MNRRLALKQLAVASAAAYLLPSCVRDSAKVSVALKNLKITPDDEALLSVLAETVIPETDTPGAKSVGAVAFTFVMVDDCMKKEDQEKYVSGMRQFDEEVRKRTGTTFQKMPPDERLSALVALEKENDSLPGAVRHFYFRSKGYIIQAYTSSQHFLTDIQAYEHVPGAVYKGCVTLKSSNTI